MLLRLAHKNPILRRIERSSARHGPRRRAGSGAARITAQDAAQCASQDTAQDAAQQIEILNQQFNCRDVGCYNVKKRRAKRRTGRQNLGIWEYRSLGTSINVETLKLGTLSSGNVGTWELGYPGIGM